MAIRLRTSNGIRIALCAAETDAMPGDSYLDDGDHYALAAKFASDWQGQRIDWGYSEEWPEMERHKLRDAVESLNEWLAAQCARSAAPRMTVETQSATCIPKEGARSNSTTPPLANQ